MLVVSLMLGAIVKKLVNPENRNIVIRGLSIILKCQTNIPFLSNTQIIKNHTWALMRLIVADAGSISADLRAFFLRRLGSNGRLLLLAVLNTTPART